MILKTADDKAADLGALDALLSHPDATQATRKNIEQEIRAIRTGIKGETEAAYEIDFHKRMPGRLDCGGKDAPEARFSLYPLTKTG